MTPEPKINPFMRIQYNSPVILTFALLSLFALGLAELTYRHADWCSNMTFFSVWRGSFSWTDPLAYLRIFTHAIGHVNAAHFLNNFVLILLVGPMLEERYGWKWLGLMMLVTALITGVLHMFISPNPKLGASGIVFMLILLASFTNLQKGRVPLTLLLALGIFIGREILTAAGDGASANIAYMTHIVGGLCGAMFGFVANRAKLRG
ncbi:MAG: rhomboid family intramembrane serine protease [Defluviitaleaceae bacterium]|nr:rhomboid family intramembrane serine protease [Defluviitaleaceae bacterium]